jgi:hypothetical protein
LLKTLKVLEKAELGTLSLGIGALKPHLLQQALQVRIGHVLLYELAGGLLLFFSQLNKRLAPKKSAQATSTFDK